MNKFSWLLVISLVGGIFLAPQESLCGNDHNEKSLETVINSAAIPYKIGSGDILEIVTWKEADFSRPEVLVRIDGKITFPLLGDIQAADRTTTEVKQEIEKRLKTYIENPVVTVTVVRPESQKFYILGEVMRTGEYNLVKHLTVLQAFAIAGGFTQWASKKEIKLLRKNGMHEEMITINYKNIVKGEDLSQNIELRADDTIIVP